MMIMMDPRAMWMVYRGFNCNVGVCSLKISGMNEFFYCSSVDL